MNQIKSKQTDLGDALLHSDKMAQKRRLNQIAGLKDKTKDLQKNLSKLEILTKAPPTVEIDKRMLKKDQKDKWRLEIERRENELKLKRTLSPLYDRVHHLRIALEDEKKLFKKLNKKVASMQDEVKMQLGNAEDAIGIVLSYKLLEDQLQERLAERSKLRDTVSSLKMRNDRLDDEVSKLNEEIKTIDTNLGDDSARVDSLTKKQKQLKEALEVGKSLLKLSLDRYEEDVEGATKYADLNSELFFEFRHFASEENVFIKEVREEKYNLLPISEKFVVEEPKPEDIHPEPSPETEDSDAKSKKGKKKGKKAKPKKEKKVKPKKGKAKKGKKGKKGKKELEEEEERRKEEEAKALAKKQAEEKAQFEHSVKVDTQKMKLELLKYKTMSEAANKEVERLTFLHCNQEQKMGELAILTVESGRLLIQKSEEIKEAHADIAKFRKAQSKKSGPASDDTKMLKKVFDLPFKIELIQKENEELRKAIATWVENKVDDFEIFKDFVNEAVTFCVDSSESIMKKLQEDADAEAAKAAQDLNPINQEAQNQDTVTTNTDTDTTKPGDTVTTNTDTDTSKPGDTVTTNTDTNSTKPGDTVTTNTDTDSTKPGDTTTDEEKKSDTNSPK